MFRPCIAEVSELRHLRLQKEASGYVYDAAWWLYDFFGHNVTIVFAWSAYCGS